MIEKDEVTIRKVEAADAPKIADLSQQMDHEMTAKEAQERIAVISSDSSQALFVAEYDGKVLGYVSVFVNYELLSGVQARIGGMVVDDSTRGLGLGRKLMEMAEQWAREKGSKTMKLASNMNRTEAHKFYEKIGYTKAKEQAAFKKAL